jgi:hypothetical protein
VNIKKKKPWYLLGPSCGLRAGVLFNLLTSIHPSIMLLCFYFFMWRMRKSIAAGFGANHDQLFSTPVF